MGSDLPRPRLGELTLDERLGAGAVGEVFRAFAPDGTRVAVKVARAEVVEDARILRLLETEIRAMARLDHPHVLWLYDRGLVPDGHPSLPAGVPYLVLEHCGGGSLRPDQITSWEELTAVLVPLLSALCHAHGQGLIHRDLKPANVLWSDAGDARAGLKLADFGVAHLIGGGPLLRTAGTLAYMPPEVQQGRLELQGPWTDLYALGVVAWELAHGSPPLLAMDGTPTWTRPRFSLPEGWVGWIASLLRPRPSDRVRSAAAAWEALRSVGPTPEHLLPPRGWRARPAVRSSLRLRAGGTGLAALRVPRIVGRVEEQRRLWSALQDVTSGRHPRVVAVAGPAGIGKTRLLEALAERAAEVGLARVVRVGFGPGAEPARALIVGLLRLQDVPGYRVADAVRRALSRRLEPAAVDRVLELVGAGDARFATARVVSDLITSEAAAEPLVLLLDDADDSVAALHLGRTIAAGVVSGPVLGVVCARSAPKVDGVACVTLGPLHESEANALLDAEGAEDDERTWLLARGGGHPGWLVERLRSRATIASTPDPTDERAALLAAADLDDASTIDLELAAWQGVEVDEELWDVSCDPGAGLSRHGLDTARMRRRVAAVQRLHDLGIVRDTDRGFAFVHPGYVEQLRARSVRGRRAEEQGRTVALRAEERGDWNLAASLLDGIGDHERVLSLTLVGVQNLGTLTAIDLERVEVLLERALDRCGASADDPRRGWSAYVRSTRLLLGGRLVESGEVAEAGIALAEAGDDHPLLARLLMRRVESLGQDHGWSDTEPYLRRFLEVERGVHPDWPGMARGRLARVYQARGDHAEAERWAVEGERLLRDGLESGGARRWCNLVEVLDIGTDPKRRRALLAVGARAARLAREEGRPQDEVYVTSRMLNAALELEDLDLARQLSLSAERLSLLLGHTRSRVLALGQRTLVELTAGDLAAAAEAGDAALASCAALDDRHLLIAIAVFRGEVALRVGDRRTALHLARRVLGLDPERAGLPSKDAPLMRALLLEDDLEDDTTG